MSSSKCLSASQLQRTTKSKSDGASLCDITLRGRFGDTDSSYTLTGSSTKDTVGYDVTGDFVGDIKLGWMSTHKDLNLGMSYGFSAGDAGRQAHRIEATMRVLLD